MDINEKRDVRRRLEMHVQPFYERAEITAPTQHKMS